MWYRIFHSHNSKEIGKFPQVHHAIVPTTVNDPRYLSNWLFSKAPLDVLVPEGVLADKAKPTDLISVAFIGFELRLYVSAKLKECIMASYYFGMQYFKSPLVLQSTGEELAYWIIHPFEFGFECLDYSTSKFMIQEGSDGNLIPVEIKNYKELIQKLTSNAPKKTILIERISLREDIPNDFVALGNVRNGGVGYFVSEKLKSEIQKRGCTGLEFFEANEVKF